jgi:signal transduction histidine kinase
VIVAILLPAVADLLSFVGLTPPRGYNLAPSTLLISALILAWAVVHERLLDLVPIASRLVMEHMRDAVIVLDGRDQVVDCNRAALSLLDMDLTALIGKPVAVAFGKWPALIASLNPAGSLNGQAAPGALSSGNGTAGGETEEIGQRTTHGVQGAPAAPEWVFDVAISPIEDASRGNVGRVAVLRDVTAARALEQAKDDFTSMVAHELRSPLGVVKGFVSTLLRPGGADDPVLREELLGYVDEASDRLLNLMDQNLDLSRIDAGVFTVDPLAVRLEPLLTAVVQRAAGQVRREKDSPNHVHLKPVPALPAVMADPPRFEQVMQNLIENARRYSPPGTVVTVSARLNSSAVTVTAPGAVAGGKGGMVEVAVADEGDGMSPEELDVLFDRYRRGKSARRRGVSGSGLGLAIVRSLVESHGGRVWAESPAPGREGRETPGTIVRFTLPVASPASARPVVLADATAIQA